MVNFRWVRIWALAIGTVAFAGGAFDARAQSGPWPNRPIRLVVPFAPGGASDVLARLVGQRLAERLGQPVVVENKPGAATTVGAAEVARASDGHTIMLAPAPFVIATLMYPNLTYGPKDFAGVALLATSPLMLTAHPSVPVNSVTELVALSKAKPNSVSYASPGNGSVPHLAGELLKTKSGAALTHVPYKGGGPAVNDLVAGHVGVMFASPIEVAQHVAAGKLKYLATSTAKRVPSIPNVPTVAESVAPGFDIVAWFGIVAPASMPKDAVARLSQEIGRILEAGDVREKFAGQGADLAFMPAGEFDTFLAREREQWGLAIKASGAKVE